MVIEVQNGYAVVDTNTNEIVKKLNEGDVLSARSREQIERSRRFYEDQKKELRRYRIENPVEERDKVSYSEDKSEEPFVWCICDTAQKLMPDIQPSTLSRLMLLATYRHYKDNRLLDDGGRNPLTRQDVKEILHVSDKVFRNTIGELVSNRLMTYRDHFELSGELFSRGRMIDADRDGIGENRKSMTRLYRKGIRGLYQSACKGSVSKLSYVFRILPFVNWKYNVVCRNPLEVSISKIIPLSVGDIAAEIGFGRKNAAKLRQYLQDARFETEQGSSSAVKYLYGDQIGIENHCWLINPDVYYGGKNKDRVEILKLFV